MKTQTLEHVPEAELRRMIEDLVQRTGSQKDAAMAVGVGPTMMTHVLKGKVFPGRKFPEFFGLKMVRVFVPIKQTKRK